MDLIFGRPHQAVDDWIKELFEVCYIFISSEIVVLRITRENRFWGFFMLSLLM